MRSNSSFLPVVALVLNAVLLVVAVADASSPPSKTHPFDWHRGPIREELARVANHRLEEPEVFERRIHRYAWAVSDGAREHYRLKDGFLEVELRALLVTTGNKESHWDKQVCEDFTRGAPGAPAVGCWQTELTERAKTVEEFASVAAYDLTRAGRYCVARGFPRVSGAISLYATGEVCNWKGAPERVRMYEAVLYRLSQ